jgi:hypothetical protein
MGRVVGVSKMGVDPGKNPHARRWMMFVDGENFTIQGQNYFLKPDTKCRPVFKGAWWEPNVFLWVPRHVATLALTNVFEVAPVQQHSVRSYYYTTMASGDEDRLKDIRRRLHDLQFQPEVFRRNKQGRSKGVDLTLAKDLLGNAFLDNFDVAVLVAGDGDYVPLVQEVKRLGKLVYVVFFEESLGLSEDLVRAADIFFDIRKYFCQKWGEPTLPTGAEYLTVESIKPKSERKGAASGQAAAPAAQAPSPPGSPLTPPSPTDPGDN